MYVYYLWPNTKASQAVDYALNTGLVLFFLEFNIVIFRWKKTMF